MVRTKIFEKINEERDRQDAKWGIQNHDEITWGVILGEEVGEVCQQALRVHFGNVDTKELEEELIQVMAVCACWLENS